jgi:hypothetical protein
MKKSQMLAEIVSVLKDTDLLSYSDRAMAVLCKIESLGMKPPVEETCPVLFQTTFVWETEENEGSQDNSGN